MVGIRPDGNVANRAKPDIATTGAKPAEPVSRTAALPGYRPGGSPPDNDSASVP